MNKKIKYLLIISILVLSAAGCSSGLNGALFKAEKNIPADKSLVYIYKPKDKYWTEFDIRYNKHEIFTMKNGGYFPLYVKPGKVEITSKVIFKLFVTGILDKAVVGPTSLVFTAKPGKFYYVECTAGDYNGDKLRMKLVTKDYGSVRISTCRLLPKTESKQN